MLKAKYNNWMKIIKIYTIRAAHKLLLSVEVISRYSQVWLGPGWDLAGSWLGRNKTFIDEKCAPGWGELGTRQQYSVINHSTALNCTENRTGDFNEIFSRPTIFEGIEPLGSFIWRLRNTNHRWGMWALVLPGSWCQSLHLLGIITQFSLLWWIPSDWRRKDPRDLQSPVKW